MYNSIDFSIFTELCVHHHGFRAFSSPLPPKETHTLEPPTPPPPHLHIPNLAALKEVAEPLDLTQWQYSQQSPCTGSHGRNWCESRCFWSTWKALRLHFLRTLHQECKLSPLWSQLQAELLKSQVGEQGSKKTFTGTFLVAQELRLSSQCRGPGFNLCLVRELDTMRCS